MSCDLQAAELWRKYEPYVELMQQAAAAARLLRSRYEEMVAAADTVLARYHGATSEPPSPPGKNGDGGKNGNSGGNGNGAAPSVSVPTAADKKSF